MNDDIVEICLGEYFEMAHEEADGRKQSIGDLLTFLIGAVEVLSREPVNFMLEHGVVVFPDVLCLHVQKLSEFVRVSVHDLYELLERSQYISMRRIPQNCVKCLIDLGFINSMDFQLFAIPETDVFVSFIRMYRVVVQPFPIEMTDLMIYARQAAYENAQSRISDFVQAAKQRLVGCNIMLDVDQDLNACLIPEEEEEEEEEAVDTM